MPEETKIEFVMVAGTSFDEAFRLFGKALRTYHGKKALPFQPDLARKYLGYWTDNGAFYYYNTLPGMNYEQTLIKLDQEFQEKGLPMRYLEVSVYRIFVRSFCFTLRLSSLTLRYGKVFINREFLRKVFNFQGFP